MARRLADTARPQADLGFEAEIGLEEGLTRLVEWWAEHREGRFDSVEPTVAQAS